MGKLKTTQKRVKATGDLAFKKVFGSVGNEDIIAGLVNDFFGFEPTGVVITNPYDIKVYDKILKDSGGDFTKLSQTLNDVGAEIINGSFIAEMQMNKQKLFLARTLYYVFSRYCANYARNGNKYDDLRPVYSLNILCETWFDMDECAVKLFHLYDEYDNIKMPIDYLSVAFLEIEKTTGYRNKHQECWKRFFLGEDLPPDVPVYIRKAEKYIDFANLGKEERRMISLEEKARADYESVISTAKDDGREEGARLRSFDIARNMIDKGYPASEIEVITGLSEEEIKSL